MINKLRKYAADLTDKATNVLLVASLFVSAIIYLLHIITHFPFFDGTIHTRYLWLLSTGLRPNIDFFCLYPTLGYFLTLPYFNLFPESAFVLIALRLFSAVIVSLIGIVFYFHGRRIANNWIIALLPFLLISTDRSIGVFFSEYSVDHITALAALWALTIFMSEPRFGKLVLCSVLSVISLFIMPKYHFQLFFGLLGYICAYYANLKKASTIFWGLLAGLVAALLITSVIFILNNGSLINNFRYAYLFNLRLSSVLDDKFDISPIFSPVIFYVTSFLRYHPVLSVTFLLGITGWARYTLKTWRRPDHYILSGGGILIGCLASSLSTTVYCEQYIAPIILCVALFVPFAYTAFPLSGELVRRIQLLFIGTVFCMLVVRLNGVADEFELTPFNSRGNTVMQKKLLGEVIMAPTGINILNEYDDLLDMIPENEKVVAAWPFHPIFRQDLTFQIFDDRPSISYGFKENDPMLMSFSTETFKAALEKSPPALIIIQGMNEYYPLGWDKVATDFISCHQDMYTKYSTKLLEGYIRKDLLE